MAAVTSETMVLRRATAPSEADASVPAISGPDVARVTLVGGFLGAGKTSVVNQVLGHVRRERLAVIVNDFGALNLDGSLIESSGGESVALGEGCVCCSVRDDLVDTLGRLVERAPRPRRILVELSGISDPGKVVRTVAMLERSMPLVLDGVIVVVDAEQFPSPDAAHYLLARDQLCLADLVVVNKVDLVAAQGREALQERLHRYVPEARIVSAKHGAVPLELLLGESPRGREALPPAEDAATLGELPGGAHGFCRAMYGSESPMDLERLRRAATELPPWVFRVKGTVYLRQRPRAATQLQVVGRRARIDRGAPWGSATPRTELLCIGAGRDFDAAVLRACLGACEALEPRSFWRRLFRGSPRRERLPRSSA